jgi:hypothetical protein
MSSEKLHNSFNWKNKLDELNHLPGESATDKTLSWEKLHARLQKNTRYKGSIRYWMVAASILLVIGFTWFYMNQKNANLIRNNSKQKQEESITYTPQLKKERSINKVTDLPKNKRTVASVLLKDNQVNLKDSRSDRIHSDTGLNIDQDNLELTTVHELQPLVINSGIEQKDTTAHIVTLPAKKKIRVVHINEIGSLEEDMQLVDKTNTPSFPSKSFTQNEGLSSISISKNGSDDLLKIKLSPSN